MNLIWIVHELANHTHNICYIRSCMRERNEFLPDVDTSLYLLQHLPQLLQAND